MKRKARERIINRLLIIADIAGVEWRDEEEGARISNHKKGRFQRKSAETTTWI